VGADDVTALTQVFIGETWSEALRVVTGPEVKADHQEEQDVTLAETERLTILLRNRQTETSRLLRNRDELVIEKAGHRDDAGHGCLFAAL
jgi:hypothetical protein